jgi:hypothetical protein
MPRGGDAKTGKFVSKETVKKNPNTTVMESIKQKKKPKGKQ